MKLTFSQEGVFQLLKKEIDRIKNSQSRWGLALIGPDGYGKSTIIREMTQKISTENLKFIYLDLFIPAICPEEKNVRWEECLQKTRRELPDVDFRAIEKIESSVGKIEKAASICKEAGKRILVVLDHFELCKDWREARWPIENEIADVVVVCNDEVWKDREKTSRVVTSFFFKRVHIEQPFDFKKDEKIFGEIISRFELSKPKILELYENLKNQANEGRILGWNEIFRLADEMEGSA